MFQAGQDSIFLLRTKLLLFYSEMKKNIQKSRISNGSINVISRAAREHFMNMRQFDDIEKQFCTFFEPFAQNF